MQRIDTENVDQIKKWYQIVGINFKVAISYSRFWENLGKVKSVSEKLVILTKRIGKN